MTGPTISVITPFLNSERFIADAIESVLLQTYHDWELILIDDGTTDESTDIALKYTHLYPDKLHYFQHQNHAHAGASATRNLGIRHARGRFIAFLDSDDVYHPYQLEQQLATLNSHPDAAMLYGLTQYWYGWTGKTQDIEQDYIPSLGVPLNTLFEPKKLFIPFFLSGEVLTPCPCSVLMKRELIDYVGGFEESFHYIYTDQALYSKIALVASIFVADNLWGKYRQHPDSCCYTVARNGREAEERWFFLKWLRGYLLREKIAEKEIWEALEIAITETRLKLSNRPLKIGDER